MTKLGASAKRWFWLRDGLIPAGQAVSETIPLYALIVLVDATGQHGITLAYASLAGIVATAAWLTRLTDLLPQPWYFGRVILCLLTALCLVLWGHLTLAPTAAWDPVSTLTLVTRPWHLDPAVSGSMLFLAWFLGICLWSRGLWIGLEPADARAEARWFIGGMAFLLVLVAVASTGTAAQIEAISHPLRLLVLIYFFVGLLVLALVHSSTLRGTGGPAPGASVPWLIAVAVPIAAVPVIGLFLTVGAAPAVRMAMQAAVVAGLFTWHLVLWIGYWILLFLAWLSSLFPAGPAGKLRSGIGRPHPPPEVKLPQLSTHFAVSTFDATVICIVLVAGVLGALLASLLTRRRTIAEAAMPDDERSSVWSWALFLSQLGAVWASLWRRNRRAATPKTQPTVAPLASASEDEFDVRALYRRFERRAAELQNPRPPIATPMEFARTLIRSAPSHRTDIGLVTETYDRVRYGQKVVDGQKGVEMRDAVRRWEGAGLPEADAQPQPPHKAFSTAP